MKINQYGAIIVNDYPIRKDFLKYFKVEFLTIDCVTKRAKVSGYGNNVNMLEGFDTMDFDIPFIILSYDEGETVYHDEELINVDTIISFPEYQGWQIYHSQRLGKYEIEVLFYKRKGNIK